MADQRPWVRMMEGTPAERHARFCKNAAGLVLLPAGDSDVMHREVRRLVAAGVNPGDVPAAPWGPIFEPEFLAVIKPLAIVHPAAWAPHAGDPLGERVMAWARELGQPVYLTQDFSMWLFVSLEPFPEGRKTESRVRATPDGVWELLE